MEKEEFTFIQDQIGYQFKNLDLLQQAFVRRSYSQENGGEDNEVLEFIGDRALDIVVVKYLADTYGGFAREYEDFDADDDYDEFYCAYDESELSKIKQSLVCRKNLAKCIEKLELEEFLIMGESDVQQQIWKQDSVKEDLFEAIVGAVTLDSQWNFDQIEDAVKIMLGDTLSDFSDEEIAIPDGHVSGETHFTALKNNTVNISNYIYSLGAILVSAIVIWLIGLWLSPKLLHNTSHSITLKKVLQIIGLGILVPIVIVLLSIIILLIPITSQLTILLLCILAILFFISTSVAIINVNTMICDKLKITQNLYKLGFLIVTTIVYWLLTLIPYVGMVISLIAIIWGIGSISYSILIKEKSDEKNSNSDKKISDSEEKKEEIESKVEKENKTDKTKKDKDKSNKTSKKENKKTDKDKNKNNDKKSEKKKDK